jgi:hypothetical protein
MKFLIDQSPLKMKALMRTPELVMGQLLTPLTRYANAGVPFAIDNGAFSGLDAKGFRDLLERELPNKERCLFVVVPDVVASARRTLELFERRRLWVHGWPVALVAQDGQENLPVPWEDIDCLFIGGGDPWKEIAAARDLVRTAKALEKHVHVGRVNSWPRYKLFRDLGADTCDGSGMSRFSREKFAQFKHELVGEQNSLFS